MACIVCHAPLECNRSVTIGTMELPTISLVPLQDDVSMTPLNQ